MYYANIMKLSDWQKKTKTTNTALAKALGVDDSYISYINSGSRTPSLRIALKIEEITDRQVTVRDIFSQNPNNNI